MSDLNINEDAQSGGEGFSGAQSSPGQQNETQNNPSQPVDSSAFPDEDEETITMLDVIEREDELEEEASAVLGNSDEKNCTYPKGYIARQALYSCATCSNKSGQEAAICLACSLECHENHELYELYTKRNYRCDCGNSRFKSDFECKLSDKQNKKAPLNENNSYNHNFFGRYCNCDRPYPPDENDESPESNDEMWQCIVCEDWYHTKHLEAKSLPSKFEELACGKCVEKLEFIKYYNLIDKLDPSKRRSWKINQRINSDASINNDHDDDGTENNNTEIVGPFSVLESKPKDKELASADAVENNNTKTSLTITNSTSPSKHNANSKEISESDTNDSQAENKDPIKDVLNVKPANNPDCILELLKDLSQEHKVDNGPIFWPDCNWRSELCRCQKCMGVYDSKNCLYLIDEKDTVHYYEAQGKALAKNNQTPMERGMSALKGMNRAAVAEALNGYDELKADLSLYLRKFADTKKVVREADIHEFFEQLRSKKRPKFG